MKIFMLCGFAVWLAVLPCEAANNKVNPNAEKIEKICKKENMMYRQINKFPHQRIDWNDRLNMNDTQREYSVKVYQESHTEIAKIAEQIKELNKKIDEIIRADDEKIYKILNEKQQSKMQKIQLQIKRLNGEKDSKNKTPGKKMRLMQVN